jgi:hypothetical protein
LAAAFLDSSSNCLRRAILRASAGEILVGFLGAGFFAVGFLGAGFFAVGFLGAAFLGVDFLGAGFFAVGFLGAAFLGAGFFATAFFLTCFFAVGTKQLLNEGHNKTQSQVCDLASGVPNYHISRAKMLT